jgi:hypothetical protein
MKAPTLEKVLKIGSWSYILARHLQIDADPDPIPDPAFHFDPDPDSQFGVSAGRLLCRDSAKSIRPVACAMVGP